MTLGGELPLGKDTSKSDQKWAQDSSLNRKNSTKQNRQKNSAGDSTRNLNPMSDRTFDKKPRDFSRAEDNTNSNNIYTTSHLHSTVNSSIQRKLADTFEMGQVNLDFNGKEYGNSMVGPHIVCGPPQSGTVRRQSVEPLKMAECNTYNAMSFMKPGKSGRVGSANSGGSREDKTKYPTTDKYFDVSFHPSCY